MKLIKELKGGSLSKTILLSDGKRKWVRKLISIETNREYGLVRWQSQLRKSQLLNLYLPENTLPILRSGVIGESYFFDMEFLENSQTLHDALLDGLDPQMAAKVIFELLQKLASYSLENVQGSLSLYINEELKRPLQLAKVAIVDANIPQSDRDFLGQRLNIAFEIATELTKHYENYKIYESLTHGNLTLENILWDSVSKRPVLIDTYAETYCETILGDVSQIFQSSRSGYEFISNFFDENNTKITIYPYDKIPDILVSFSDHFESLLSNEKWYDKKILNLLRASQFTRMFPFKLVNNEGAGYLFLNHALDLLENV